MVLELIIITLGLEISMLKVTRYIFSKGNSSLKIFFFKLPPLNKKIPNNIKFKLALRSYFLNQNFYDVDSIIDHMKNFSPQCTPEKLIQPNPIFGGSWYIFDLSNAPRSYEISRKFK